MTPSDRSGALQERGSGNPSAPDPTNDPRRRHPHGFTVEQDMDVVLITTRDGARYGLDHEQVVNLIDDLIDAAGDAAHWQSHDPFERDQTYKED